MYRFVDKSGMQLVVEIFVNASEPLFGMIETRDCDESEMWKTLLLPVENRKFYYSN